MIEKKVAIIPARSGSKGLPNKNKRMLNGKPLILHTVDAAVLSKVFDKIIVSTNDSDIKCLFLTDIYQDIEVNERPDEYCQDNTEMFAVVKYLIGEYGLDDDTLLTLLQPTSPLRDNADIQNAFQMFDATKHKALISVVETDNSVLKQCILNGNVLEGIRAPEMLFMNRQSLPKTYKPNGALYIYKVKDLLEHKGFHLDNVTPFYMSAQKSLDIDVLGDFEKIESMLN